MSQLITKIQYRNCEAGEFFNIALRTFEETVEQIKGYPWALQRVNASVHFTCPSVSIENHSGNFLKLGPYYNGKFCLYLLDSTGVLSRCVLLTIEDSFPIIQDFYNDKSIAHHFSSLSFVFHARKHFVTNRFEYTVTFERVIRFLIFPEIPLTVYFGFSISRMILKVGSFFSFVFGLMLFMFIAGFNLFLFVNYYFFSKDLYLRLSAGHDRFLFGRKDDIREYCKDDIEIITLYHNRGQRCPWGFYYVYEIHFTNGDFIQFPSLLISEIALLQKLPGKKTEEVHEFLATCLKSKLTD